MKNLKADFGAIHALAVLTPNSNVSPRLAVELAHFDGTRAMNTPEQRPRARQSVGGVRRGKLRRDGEKSKGGQKL